MSTSKKKLAIKAAVSFIKKNSALVRKKHRHHTKHTKHGSRLEKQTRVRTRRKVMDIFCELGRIYFRRAYRMTIESFWKLYRLVSDSIKVSMKSSTKNRKRYVPNGPVHPSVVLACGLRLFAGGSKYDLATTFGISVTYVEYSMNWVIDAVVNCNNLKVVFPDCHLKQKKLAKEFEKKSTPGF